MSNYKTEFIEFMVDCGVLTFGDFTTKSGRKTPFFINTGLYKTGSQIDRLGSFYARCIVENFGRGFDVLFGPAYKGIPLAVAAASALSREHGIDIAFSFNRKEAKDHGEGGVLVGHKFKGGERVIIIEDVTTAGTSIRETLPVLHAAAADVKVIGLAVSVDRQERGTGEKTALAEIRDEFGIAPAPIVTLDDVVAALYKREYKGRVLIDETMKEKIDAYRALYGAK